MSEAELAAKAVLDDINDQVEDADGSPSQELQAALADAIDAYNSAVDNSDAADEVK